jgi:hypothetical protein
MSICKNCGNSWDATAIPSCPVCQVHAWTATNLVTFKHHPPEMPSPTQWAGDDYETGGYALVQR